VSSTKRHVGFVGHWSRRLVRFGVLAILLLAVLYVSLPWWLPRGVLRSVIQQRLSARLNLPVTVGLADLSWSTGLQIDNLSIQSEPAFGSAPMVVVGRLTADYSPISLLLNNRLDWLTVSGVRVNAQFDQAGNCNLAPLAKSDSRDKTQILRLSVQQSQVSLRFPRQQNDLVVNINDMQMLGGRMNSLGSVSVSACLAQQGGDAPMSLRLSGGGDNAASAAMAAINFANIDLEQMNLPLLLGLPLDSLQGRCDGSVNLQVSSDLKAPNFDCSLTVRQLDAQPAGGPNLPIIEQAGVNITASYDLGKINIHSAKVHLPGLELAGVGSCSLDAIGGNWHAISSLNIGGTVYPATLLALFKASVPPGVPSVAGPVTIQISASSDAQSLTIDSSIDSTATTITQNQATLKAGGRPLWLKASASMDHSLRRVQLRQFAFQLGLNQLTCSGEVQEPGELIQSACSSDVPLKALLQVVSRLSLKGNWVLRDLPALREMLQSPVLDLVNIDGAISGDWLIDPKVSQQAGGQAGTHLLGSIHSDRDSQLGIAGVFTKPAGEPMSLLADGYISADGTGLQDVNLDLSIAQGVLGINAGRLEMQAGNSGGNSLSATGQLHCDQIDKLLACSSQAELVGRYVQGSLKGSFTCLDSPAARQADIYVDAGTLGVNCGRVFFKDMKTPAGLRVHLSRDAQAGRQGPTEIQGVIDLPHAQLDVWATLNSPAGSGAKSIRALADIKDAEILLKTSPVLAELLPDWQASGKVTIDASGQAINQGLSANLKVIADDLDLTSAAQPRRRKAAGTKMRLDLAGQLTIGSDGTSSMLAEVENVSIMFGASSLAGEGRAEAGINSNLPPVGDWSHQAPYKLLKLSGSTSGDIAIDQPLTDLLPELGTLVSRHGLGGNVLAQGSILRDETGLSLSANIDATNACVGQAGPFAKPTGVPMTLGASLAMDNAATVVSVNSMQCLIGNLRFLADGRASITRPADAPLAITPQNAHLAVSTDKLQALEPLMPGWQKYQLAGDAFVDVEYRRDAAGGQSATIDFTTAGLEATVGGKRVRSAGLLTVSDVWAENGKLIQAGRFSTDRLDFAIGDNAGSLSADVRNPAGNPIGQVDLICKYIDDVDMANWLDACQANTPEAASQPASMPAKALTKASAGTRASQSVKVDELLAGLKTYLTDANLDVHVSIDNLRTYDPVVKQTYDARYLDLRACVQSSDVNVTVKASVSGGAYSQKLHTSLKDVAPMVSIDSDLRDLEATEAIRPQVEQFFPGNLVYGTFSRVQQITIPLKDVIANRLDPSHTLHPVGNAVTVTTDGLLQGQAAPKFVTSMFPGLNLMKYRYKKMTAFADLRNDGSAYNDMIFDGYNYNTYIEGSTDSKNVGRYEIGLILLGSPQSPEYNHTYRLGRTLLMTFQARIQDGKMYDQVVAYPWPNETFGALFMKNNSIYQLWKKSQVGK
jgi:hypothetical protein